MLPSIQTAAPAATPNAIEAFDRKLQELADWSSIKTRCKPEIGTLEDYRISTTLGLVEAHDYLETQAHLNPNMIEIRQAHALAFGDAERNVGAPRKDGELATFGGSLGAEAQRVPIEHERLKAEMDEIMSQATTGPQKCAALAFYHARFIGIHPFLDGNGRVGRAILAAQAARTLGDPLPLMRAIAEDKKGYIAASEASRKSNDLCGLTTLIGKSYGITIPQERIESPFAIASRRMLNLGDIKPLAQERAMARTGAGMPLASRSQSFEMSM